MAFCTLQHKRSGCLYTDTRSLTADNVCKHPQKKIRFLCTARTVGVILLLSLITRIIDDGSTAGSITFLIKFSWSLLFGLQKMGEIDIESHCSLFTELWYLYYNLPQNCEGWFSQIMLWKLGVLIFTNWDLQKVYF